MERRPGLSPRFAYVYFMKNDPERVRGAVAGHVEYWRRLRLDGYLGGPFEDRSGGLITFDAEDQERAGRAVSSDPFVVRGLLEAYWLKRWMPE
jgi:uncharacterized protein YciI